MPHKPAECGTEGGYYRHLRVTKTKPCKRCVTAHNVAENVRAAKRAAKIVAKRTAERLAQGTTAADQAVEHATQLVCMVRDDGPNELGEFLDELGPDALYALTVTLAAMVPDDRTVEQLLAWQRPPRLVVA